MTDGAAPIPLRPLETESTDTQVQGQRVSLRLLLCRGCGDVIGVYEPLVVCESSHSRTTSRAAEPGLDTGGTYYHSMCFAERDDQTLG